MKAWIPLTLVLALGIAANARATCTYPRAPDAPPDGIAPEIRPDGKALRYAVQCVDHDTGPIFYGTLRDAERAVRQSPGWCTGCAGLLMARPKVRTRNRALAR